MVAEARMKWQDDGEPALLQVSIMYKVPALLLVRSCSWSLQIRWCSVRSLGVAGYLCQPGEEPLATAALALVTCTGRRSPVHQLSLPIQFESGYWYWDKRQLVWHPVQILNYPNGWSMSRYGQGCPAKGSRNLAYSAPTSLRSCISRSD
jgi:hypothetical protein